MKLKNLDQKKKLKFRLIAAKLMEEWHDVDEVAHTLGCRREFVNRWYQRFQEGGVSALQTNNTVGRPSILNGAQKTIIKKLLFEHSPIEFGYDLALWTNRSIIDLIETLFTIKLRIPSINRLLENFGITHLPPSVAASPRDLFSQVKSVANVERGNLMFFFQAPIKIASNEFGDRPSVPAGIVLDRRKPPKCAWLMGAVDKRNSKRFMITFREPGDDQFVMFLERLIYNVANPINLLVEQNGLLDTPAIKAFTVSVNGRLRLIRYNGQSPYGGRVHSRG